MQLGTQLHAARNTHFLQAHVRALLERTLHAYFLQFVGQLVDERVVHRFIAELLLHHLLELDLPLGGRFLA
jgi:hypothetical protein